MGFLPSPWSLPRLAYAPSGWPPPVLDRARQESGGRGRSRVDIELHIDALQMFGDGESANPEVVADLLVRVPSGHERKNLRFPFR